MESAHWRSPRTGRVLPRDRRKKALRIRRVQQPGQGRSFHLHARRVEQPGQDRSFTVRVVTEPAATGPSPAAIGPDGAPPRAGQVVRRVLLRRNIVIDAETAQLVAAAVQAALQADAPGARVDT